ncbi:hypothetical protein BDV93DRAFT_457440, partial [Ceratobasidium sp. AG-I]
TRSTHNQRIERLWLDVGKQFGRPWKAFFLRLENQHLLDRTNRQHLWLLQHLFMDQINDDVAIFREHWNLHGVSGPRTNDQTPRDMRFLGQIKNGLHDDPHANIDPELLQKYLGVNSGVDNYIEGATGAGALPEDVASSIDGLAEEEDDLDNSGLSAEESEVVVFLRQQLQVEKEKHVRHPPVLVPSRQFPFPLPETEIVFQDAFNIAQEDEYIPVGYGVLQDEWENGQYPETEYIGKVRKHDPSLYIPLPHAVWYPRAVKWSVGLHVMDSLLSEM